MGTIVEWYEYCALLDAVGGLHILRKSTENLRYLIRDGQNAKLIGRFLVFRENVALC